VIYKKNNIGRLMNKLVKGLAVCLLGFGSSFSVQAFDGVKVAVGQGQSSTDTFQLVALLSDFGQTFFNGRIQQHWEFGVSYWESDKGPNKEMEVFNISPVFTYDLGSADQAVLPYIDYSLGIAYVSDTSIADKKLGQHLQFDNRLGFGVRFGGEKRHDVALGARHVSNAGLDNDNDGFDVVSVSYTYRF